MKSFRVRTLSKLETFETSHIGESSFEGAIPQPFYVLPRGFWKLNNPSFCLTGFRRIQSKGQIK